MHTPLIPVMTYFGILSFKSIYIGCLWSLLRNMNFTLFCLYFKSRQMSVSGDNKANYDVTFDEEMELEM